MSFVDIFHESKMIYIEAPNTERPKSELSQNPIFWLFGFQTSEFGQLGFEPNGILNRTSSENNRCWETLTF